MHTQNMQKFYLTDVLGNKVYIREKKIGKLDDVVIIEKEKFAEVSHLVISRPFGEASLLIPWPNVEQFEADKININIQDVHEYEKKPDNEEILLKDHILDKKVIDTQDRDVEVVYDIRLLLTDHKLLVSDVDFSKYRMFRRLGLTPLGKFFQFIAGKMQNQRVPWAYIQHLPPELDRFKGELRLKVLKERLADIHPADLADIIEELDYDQRAAILNELGAEQASDTFEEIDPSVQRDIAEILPIKKIIQLISLMTPAQIADVLSALPQNQVENLLPSIPEGKRTKVKAMLEKQDEKIINVTTDKVITCIPTMTIGSLQEEYYTLAKDKDVVMYMYVVDENNMLLGVLDIKELLAADETAILKDCMVENVIALYPESTYKEAADNFERYNFRAMPVVDHGKKLIGAVTYKDIIGLRHRFIE